MSHLVGARLRFTVTVTDVATAAAVDPATFVFRLTPPASSGYTAGLYTWNGTAWTNSESTVAVPVKGATGIFYFTVTTPYANIAQGRWTVGVKSTANGSGLGEGSGETAFILRPTAVL